MRPITRLLPLFICGILLCCGKDTPAPVTPNPNPNPTVTPPTLDNAATTSSDITSTTAKVSSTVSANGGSAITQHGHVWSETNSTPTIADAKTELGATSGPFPLKFTSELKNLKANTTYNVRAYAVNDKGTTYGTATQVKTADEIPATGLANWKTARALGEGFDATNARSIISDASGNFYIAGDYSQAGKIGKFSVSPLGSQDGYVAKLDPSGEPLWIVELKSSFSDVVLSLDMDAAGNIYAGLRVGTNGATFGGVNVPTGGGQMAKITQNGTVEWVRSFGGGGSATNVDAQGNCYVLGGLLGDGKAVVGTVTLTGSGGASTLTRDSYVAKFDPTGKFLWVRQFSGTDDQNITFDVDPNGSVYVNLKSLKSVPSVSGTALSSAGEFLLKLSASGNTDWVKTIHTTDLPLISYLVCQSTGEFVAVTQNRAGITLEGVTTTVANPTAVVNYRENGNAKWSIIAPGIDVGAALDNSGNLYVTCNGNRNSPFSIGTISLPAQSADASSYMVVAKYSPTQNKWLWAVRNRVISGSTGPSNPELVVSSTGNILFSSTAQRGDVQFGTITANMPNRFGVMLATIEQK